MPHFSGEAMPYYKLEMSFYCAENCGHYLEMNHHLNQQKGSTLVKHLISPLMTFVQYRISFNSIPM